MVQRTNGLGSICTHDKPSVEANIDVDEAALHLPEELSSTISWVQESKNEKLKGSETKG